MDNPENDRYVAQTFVADLAINPVTKEVDFSNSVPILPRIEDTPELRERMKQLLDIILAFLTQEHEKLESGELKEEEAVIPLPLP